MKKRIKLMADYHCHPLWAIDEPDNIDPATLPLSENTIHALEAWTERYDATLDLADPMSSGFANHKEVEDFKREGARLFELLERELGDQFHVCYSDDGGLAVRSSDARFSHGPAVSPIERERLRLIFARLSDFEEMCDAGTHIRSFVGTPDNLPAGVAWVPKSLGAVPHLDHTRIVEMRGPEGETLLYVPLSELDGLIRQAAVDRGMEEKDIRPLASLVPDSPEVAIDGIFDLIYRLARAPKK